jgi:opine dehydrogenase
LAERLKVAICGCGTAGATLAAYLTSKDFQVNLYELPEFAEKSLKPFQERGGIEVRGAVLNGFFTPNMMTTNIKEAVGGVNIVMMTVPAFGHEKFAKTVISNLQNGRPF